MIDIADYIDNVSPFDQDFRQQPWSITKQIPQLIEKQIALLGSEYNINGNIAIHKSAIIEQSVILKGPIIISENCFIGAHAYLRGGVFLGKHVSVGPGCEIKSSIILSNSALAHFNFVGDSIVGSHVNMEAGSIIANHYNERSEKEISVLVNGERINTGSIKFGALVADYVKIGANAVLSPGTILPKHFIVGRLQLIQQVPH